MFRYIKNHNPVITIILIIFTVSGTGNAQWSQHWTLFERDLGTSVTIGPYHSYGSLFYQLKKKQGIYIWQENEFKLYKDLLLRSYKPGYGLLEFTVYPTATFSAWVERERQDLFNAFTVYKDINLIESVSGGYQEPFSISLFTGQLAAFLTMNDQENLVVAATGVSGLVLTGGWYQLFDNCFVQSNWYRVEWKLKGEGGQGDVSYDWDIKVGYRHYGLPEIANTLSFIATRSRMQKQSVDWRIGQNSVAELEVQIPVSKQDQGLSRLMLVYGKAVPFWNWMLGLKIGVSYEYRCLYDITTATFSPERNENWVLFLQPFVVWSF